MNEKCCVRPTRSMKTRKKSRLIQYIHHTYSNIHFFCNFFLSYTYSYSCCKKNEWLSYLLVLVVCLMSVVRCIMDIDMIYLFKKCVYKCILSEEIKYRYILWKKKIDTYNLYKCSITWHMLPLFDVILIYECFIRQTLY